jgi:DNA-binding XRE family transcriptional regulator
MTPERWVPAPGIEGFEVSDSGFVRRVGAFRTLKPSMLDRGHLILQPQVEGKKRNLMVAHLVARAFLPPKPSPKHVLTYNDGDPTNCRADNLRWATRSEVSLKYWENPTSPIHRLRGAGRKSKRIRRCPCGPRPVEVAARIKAERERLALSREEAARRLEMSPDVYARLEEATDPQLSTILALVRVLGMRPEAIVPELFPAPGLKDRRDTTTCTACSPPAPSRPP